MRQRPDWDDLPHTEWKCERCGEDNDSQDAECEFCEDPNRDGARFVSGDDLWQGAEAGWYSFWDGDSTGPFATEAEARAAYEDNLDQQRDRRERGGLKS